MVCYLVMLDARIKQACVYNTDMSEQRFHNNGNNKFPVIVVLQTIAYITVKLLLCALVSVSSSF